MQTVKQAVSLDVTNANLSTSSMAQIGAFLMRVVVLKTAMTVGLMFTAVKSARKVSGLMHSQKSASMEPVR